LRLLQGDLAAAREICRQYRESALRDRPSDQGPNAIAAQMEFFRPQLSRGEKLYQTLAASDLSNGEDFYGAVSYDSRLVAFSN
jgi:hypothetical protein